MAGLFYVIVNQIALLLYRYSRHQALIERGCQQKISTHFICHIVFLRAV